MSELKTRFIDDTYVEYYNTGKHELAQIYLKSEADKVIEKLERDIVKFKSSLKYLVVRGILDGPVKKAAEDLLKEE